MVRTGKVKIEINQTYALADAPRAHRDVELRKTCVSLALAVDSHATAACGEPRSLNREPNHA